MAQTRRKRNNGAAFSFDNDNDADMHHCCYQMKAPSTTRTTTAHLGSTDPVRRFARTYFWYLTGDYGDEGNF
jgi:hypothetical protein